MIRSQVAQRPGLSYMDMGAPGGDVIGEVLDGLRSLPKRVSPKFFYDETGSHLFEKITRTPEYYPTRIELGLLTRHAADIARAIGSGCVLVEPGAGSCAKVRRLLPQLRPSLYVPLDISGDFLFEESSHLHREFSWLDVLAIRADVTRLPQLPRLVPARRRVVFYPGSTLGNLDLEDARRFLRQLRSWVGSDGSVLIGIDQHKETGILERAYNDASGFTAAFNLNVLTHLNRIMPARFEIRKFQHVAFYNKTKQRIEMHLESLCDQRVYCGGRFLSFEQGERIHTENSHKYTPERFRRLAREAGFEAQESWHDEKDWFRIWHLRGAARATVH